MPEIGGDAVIYFDPATPDDLAEKLARIVDDPDRMKELSTSAMERSFQFDAGRAAEQTSHAIAKLHQGGCQSAR
jgi:glycosyltransferase involved in cell wall biosynthesis